MNAVQHTRAGKERSQNREAKSGNQQRHVPDAQQTTALLHHHRVNVSSAGDPRQKRCVFHRVPRPHATPAEHLIAPPAAECDTKSEEPPCRDGPATGEMQPAIFDLAGNQRRNRKSKWHGHADVTQIQDWWVEHHQQVILQQRVGPRPIGYPWWADDEGVRWPVRQKKEVRKHDEQHCHCPTDEWFVEPFAHPPHGRCYIPRQDQHPHQNRTLEGAPHGRKVVQSRRGRRTNFLHIQQRKVARNHRPFHDGECSECHERCQCDETRHQTQRSWVVAACSYGRGKRTKECGQKPSQQYCPTEMGSGICYEHAALSDSSIRSAFSASYSLECFTSIRVAIKVPLTTRPCATTGIHS